MQRSHDHYVIETFNYTLNLLHEKTFITICPFALLFSGGFQPERKRRVWQFRS